MLDLQGSRGKSPPLTHHHKAFVAVPDAGQSVLCRDGCCAGSQVPEADCDRRQVDAHSADPSEQQVRDTLAAEDLGGQVGQVGSALGLGGAKLHGDRTCLHSLHHIHNGQLPWRGAMQKGYIQTTVQRT